MAALVPVSVILPTRNRAAMMTRVLESLHAQTAWPAEMVICDASDDESTGTVVQSAMEKWQGTAVVWRYDKARRTGLAPQRNQAVQAATQPYVWFLDDDVILEPGCLQQLHQAVAADESVGGATATITNQGYQPPGKWAALLMRWFEHGRVRQSYAAACVGPCCTFMPDTAPDIAPLMPAEWLIGCCSLYRKSALPVPAVPDHFEGGAFGEDLAAHYACADVFVFPSLTDTFGLVILEAMAAGTPVAAYPAPGPIDILPNSGAGKLAETCEDGLREACLDALKIDREAVRAYAERFSWRSASEEFVRNLQPYPEAEKTRFWRKLRRLARLRRRPAA